MTNESSLVIIGGGLAGSEGAWQAASRGQKVHLFEMRPHKSTPAHQTEWLAELVCSNSLGSERPDRALGLLKRELRQLNSLILRCATACAVPAGGALAVGREAFAQMVTRAIEGHPKIELIREEIRHIPEETTTIVATGPLTSDALAAEIAALTGQDHLYFYDAMAPIVTRESIDQSKTFRASRHETAEADYINCPMTKAQYDRFVEALVNAETVALHDFEREDPRFFEACLPVEVMASRGHKALAFGPLRPVGLEDPGTGERPYAVVQLRQDNLAGTLYNLVGFQTNLKWSEQKRVFSLIPGLENAHWVRFGQMHRNTYINGPAFLEPTMRWHDRENLYFAGQITGTEGYVASTASGLVAGINASRTLRGDEEVIFPRTTMLGALLHYVSRSEEEGFQPMKPNMGLLPPLPERIPNKRERYAARAERSQRDLTRFIAETKILEDIVVTQGLDETG
ncbi:MAG: methylenetetrahydrofolate--tRNA-(uracil(54)-C(5))-methyltransferase (FADH(2)-oxidizing) TrmFO [Chloroflexota bacterium]|nr:methylenetetrahydrofolate--tRNA-(uracil(54)-C(5))-methyltransferase (FADH(2)-oxidizing) TrmFO [Chloroflexota bacterium]